jgi:hypothetical protein
MLFIALFVVVAFAQPTVPPPLPTYCNATSPMSNARAVSLIGAGNLGPTFISSSPAFGVYTVVCMSFCLLVRVVSEKKKKAIP